MLLGAPVLSPLLGSAWADGNPLGADELPGLVSRNKDRLTALAQLRQDPFAMDRVLGDVRSLLEIASADRVMNEAYLETAQARIGKVADALWTSDAAALSSRQFLSDLWWVDELFTSLARAGKLGPSGLGGMSTLDEGGPPNLPPTAVDDVDWTIHDRPLYVAPRGVLLNDYDPNGDILSTSLVSGPSHAASFTLGSDGSFSYTPAYHYVGDDSFVYRASDGQYTDDATVTICVTNAEPTAQDDSYSIKHDTLLSVPAIGVKYNDYDPNGDPLTAVLVSGPAHAAPGGFQLNSDGSFEYTPAYHYVGNDSFTYKVNDGIADSNTATATIEVWNIAPIALNDGPYCTGCIDDVPIPIVVAAPGVLGNDYDPDGDYPLTAVLNTPPSHGTLEYFHADGSFKYVFDPGFLGDDSFTYFANDGITNSLVPATVDLDPYRVNLRIYDGLNGNVVPDALETTRGAFTVANLNDTDADGIRDSEDQSVVLTVPNRGETEKDLMQLDIFISAENRQGSVTLEVPPTVRLWRLRYKDTECPKAGGVYSIPVEDFRPYSSDAYAYTAYVEATAPCQLDPREIRITAHYREAQDTVAATAVWVDIPPSQGTSVEDSTKSAEQVLGEFPWSTMPNDVKAYVNGTGLLNLLPGLLGGMYNGILMQFQVNPYRIVYEPERIVFFDITQRVEYNAWILRQDGSRRAFVPERWSANPDFSNDDVSGDPPYPESDEPDVPGRMFLYDSPGLESLGLQPTDGRFVIRMNFETFVRVSLYSDVNGQGLLGTRASDKFLWHSREDWVKDQWGVWDRTSWTENDRNDIGRTPTPHISLGTTWQ